MKFITDYQKQISLEEYKENNFEALILSHQELTTRKSDFVNIDEIKELHSRANNLNIDLYLRINRFFFEPDLTVLNRLLDEIIPIGLSGIILSDFGVFTMLKGLNYDREIILETDTTITSAHDANMLFDKGFTDIIVARELTLDEIIELGRNTKRPISVHVFGHQLMSTSRRKLLQAYSEETNLIFESNRIYKMREKTRPNSLYYIYEDDYGTHIYDGSILNGLDDIDRLINVRYLVVDSLNLSNQVVFDVGNRKDVETLHPTLVFGRALWDTKTTDKKEEA